MNDDDPTGVFQAIAADHRREVSESRALCVLYRALLEEHGIDAPHDAQGAEALRRYRAAFIAAGEADREQPRELTADWWATDWPYLGNGEVTMIPGVWPTLGASRILA